MTSTVASLNNLHLVDEDDTGLITDTGAAARNRANIEAMRKKEQGLAANAYSYEAVYRHEKREVLTKQVKEIKQEDKDNMPKGISISEVELEKQKDAIIADYLNPQITLYQMLRKYHLATIHWRETKKRWNVPSKGKHGRKYIKTETISSADKTRVTEIKLPTGFPESLHPALPELQLPPFNKEWRKSIKIAWFLVYEAINQ